MKPALCIYCGHWWTTEIDRKYITGRICPNCIPAITHPLTTDPATNHPKAI